MGRATMVTGVSRRRGIGFAVARRLMAQEGSRVFVQSLAAYDATQSWGADPDGINGVIAELGGEGDRLGHLEVDLADPSAAQRLVDAVVERFGAL